MNSNIEITGLLLINKPKGFTSHDVVNVIRKTLNIKKVGHTGTLDPNATGVLPILIGNATKASKYLVEHKKEYIATLKIGEKTDTGDSEGTIIEKRETIKLEKEKVEKVLKQFLGKQIQIPPMHSAIKVNGKKLYEYARNGQVVEIPKREIEIHEIELKEINENNIIVFRVICSKGTYIRTLCEDIAKKLGTIGYMENLIRTKVNNYSINNAVELENIDEKTIKNSIISIERIFEATEKIDINSRKLELFLNGVMLAYNLPDNIYRVYSNNEFIGIGIINKGLLKRDIICND